MLACFLLFEYWPGSYTYVGNGNPFSANTGVQLSNGKIVTMGKEGVFSTADLAAARRAGIVLQPGKRKTDLSKFPYRIPGRPRVNAERG